MLVIDAPGFGVGQRVAAFANGGFDDDGKRNFKFRQFVARLRIARERTGQAERGGPRVHPPFVIGRMDRVPSGRREGELRSERAMVLRDEAKVFIAAGEQHPAVEGVAVAEFDQKAQGAVLARSGPSHAALHIARPAGQWIVRREEPDRDAAPPRLRAISRLPCAPPNTMAPLLDLAGGSVRLFIAAATDER